MCYRRFYEVMAAKRGLTDVAWTGYLHSGLARPQIR